MYLNQIFMNMLTSFCFEVGSLLIVLSHWSLLASFLEANWWHFTDPSFLGISLSAIIILLIATFVPSLQIGLSEAFPFRLNFLTRVALKIISSVLLFLSSLPVFSTLSWARTGILAVGAALSPLSLIMSLSKSSTSGHNRRDARNSKGIKDLTEANDSLVGAEETNRLYVVRISRTMQPKTANSETIILIALFCSNFIRWSFGTINIFYETWEASLILCLFVFIFSVVTSYVESRNETVSDDLKIDFRAKELVNLNEHHAGDDSDRNSDLQTQLVRDPRVIKATSERFQLVVVYVRGCFQGYTFGTLLITFVWLFNTPNLLARWGNLDPDLYGLLFVFIFGCGILMSFINSASAKSSLLLMKLLSKKSEKHRQIVFSSVLELLLMTFLISALVVACLYIIRGYEDGFSVISSCLLCFSLPCCLFTNLVSLKTIFAFSNTAERIHRFALPFVTSLLAGLAFLVSHLMLIMFINPQLSTLFLGRMDLILTYQVIILFASMVSSSVLNRITSAREKQINAQDSRSSTTRSSAFADQKMSLKCQKMPAMIVPVCMLLLITSFGVSRTFVPQQCANQHKIALQAVSSAFSSQRLSNETFAVLNWNILLGHDIYGRDNLPCLAETLKIISPDIIGLEESDPSPPYWGGKDVLFYLTNRLKNGMKSYFGVNPLLSSLGVAFLTHLPVSKHRSFILPVRKSEKLPHYSLVEFDCKINDHWLTVFNIHAVYKNWTATVDNASPFSNLSTEQIYFVANKIATKNRSQPIILMGDFNLNPNEAQLDILHELGFKSALHPGRNVKPPSTLRNRFGIVDHIFYRGLNLSESKTVVETGNISDHSPTMAVFRTPT